MTLSADAASIVGNATSRWNDLAPLGTSVAVTFSFGSDRAPYDNDASSPRSGFIPYTEGQKASVRAALDQWAAVCGLVLIEVPDSLPGDIRFSIADLTAGGYAYGLDRKARLVDRERAEA